MPRKNKNNNAKSTIAVCLIGAVVLMGILAGIMMIESGSAESGGAPTEIGKGLTVHAPIYINGNSNFTSANGVSAGDGTAGNPYIIENWDINASSANGIDIRNTDSYFIIRNCIIHKGYSNHHGIYFNSMENGKIDNVTSYNNLVGIYLISSSNNNQITNCSVYNNSWNGIYLSSSSNNNITNCNVYNNSDCGIYLSSSSNNNQITNCSVYNNSECGIWLYSSNNTITNCAVYNNTYGIRLDSSSNNNITSCTISNNSYNGTSAYFSNNNLLANCTISNSGLYDFNLSGSSNLVCINTTFSKNKVALDDPTSDLTVKYYLHTKVINSTSNSISGATVRVRDNANGTFDQNYTTGADGWVRWVECTEYIQNSTLTTYYTPHNVTANKTGYVTNYSDVNMDSSKEITITLSASGGLTSRTPIYINGNSNFTSANGVTSGNGTTTDPYIIENWDIDASSANGIRIQSTNVYFIIRNCIIHDGSTSKNGIYLYSVQNGTIDNVTSYNNFYGIYLVSSSNNTITNCYTYNNIDGIYLYSSSSNTITNCNVYNNSEIGIMLSYSSNNNITNCAAYNNSMYGARLYDSPNNNITNCYVYNNSECGIELVSSLNNELRNNVLNNNAYNFGVYGWDISNYSQDIDTSNTINGEPIYYIMSQNGLVFNNTMSIGYLGLVSCSNIKVENLTLTNNIQGLLLANTSYSTITNCSAYNNSYGIELWYSSNNNITNCAVYNNSWYGIYLSWSSNNNQITNCAVYNNSRGILLSSSSNNNQITNSAVYNNSYYEGILLSSSSNNTITNCNVYNNSKHGICLESSSNNNITNCAVYNNSYGIYMVSSSNNTITNCAVYNNSYGGIQLGYSSNNNQITNCTIYNNSYNGTGADCFSNNNLLVNCIISNSGLYDFNLSDSSNLVCINTTFSKNKVILNDLNSNITVKYYLHVKVINSTGSPISGATVRVQDNANGTIDQNYTTSSDGWVRWIECTEYWQNQTTTIYYTPHNVTASKTGYVTNYASPEPNMNAGKEISITLSVAGGLTPHAPIYINGNSQFISANGITAGSGTAADPYIIENWDINASTGSIAGIEIRNTNAYFIIRNCVIHDGKSNYKYGIYFYNVTYGKIDNVTSYSNYCGIWLDSSSNNNITNCYVCNNSYGIELWVSSNNNQIINCVVYNNSENGIELWYSSNNNTITNCTAYNNYVVGINLSSSSNNLIYNNYFNNTNNAYSSGGTGNRWNITKTAGTNIINGSFLGGNYWSNYSGTDSNGDGLGDTPYIIPGGSGEQDYLPLWTGVTANDPPNPPTLTSPDNNTWTNDNTPLFDWNFSDPNGDQSGGYNVTISNTSNFTYINYWVNSSTSNNQTHWEFPGNTSYSTISDGTWYWRVKANDTNGAWSQWSEYFVLKIDTVAPYSHAPIYINGNSNFTSVNGVTSGNGTVGNPYIIENWDINASTAHGIYITNTTAYFIIRNCTIHDGDGSYNGIYFYIVQNGKIDNITSYYNYVGIRLDSSSNNTITNCYVYNNSKYGICLGYSPNNNITNCQVYNNSWDGIRLYYSSNNTIINCTVYNNNYSGISYGGIHLEYSSNNNTITKCYVYNNSGYGIFLWNSSNNLIYNNYFNNMNNSYSSGGTGNSWNILKTAGTNIINGSFLGGNYWSDYTGTDSNGDGLGDTPYIIPGGSGEQDQLPLVKGVPNNPPNPPTLISPANNTWTNDSTPLFNWTFSDPDGDESRGYNVTISSSSAFSTIDYWVNTSTGTNITAHTWGSGGESSSPIADGTWYWRVKANDTSGVWSGWSNYFILKIDTVAPYSHAPIYINSNTGFNATNGVSAGDGSASNPYIIENWDINASTAHGITIRNTDVYLIIRNCVIHDGIGNWRNGIYFYNVTNGKIDNVTSYNNFNGIDLSFYLNKNQITNCNVYNNSGCGISLTYASNNNITNCNVYNNSWGSISLGYSSNNQITNCNVYNNSWGGISLGCYSSNNTITNCNIYNNSYNGTGASYFSNNNLLVNCTISNSGLYDFNLSGSSNLVCINTTFSKNKVALDDPTSDLTVKYYLHVKVINSTSSPISGATVRVRDNANGTFDQNYTTGADGWVRWVECTEYIQNSTLTTYYTPHNVTANKTGYATNYSEPNMDSSKEITITLLTTAANNPPTLSNGGVTPVFGTPSTTFTYNVTYSDADGNSPTGIVVYILKTGANISGSPFTMTWQSGSNTTGANYTYSTTLSATGTDYTFYFNATDGTVNATPTASTDAPDVSTANNPPNPPTLTAPDNDTWTNDSTPLFDWTFSDPDGDESRGYNVTISNSSAFSTIDYWVNTSTATNVTAHTWGSGGESSSPIADGTWYWRVKANDTSGVWSNWSDWRIIKIDTALPTPTISTPSADPAYYNTTPIWFNGTCSDSLSGVSRVEINITWKDNGTTYLAWTNATIVILAANYTWWNYSFTPPNEANFTIYIKAVDNASNYQVAITRNVTYDATVPTSPTSCIEAGDATNNTWQSNVSDPSFNWSGAGDGSGSGVSGYYYYWGTNASGTSTNYTTSASYDPSAPGEGTFYLRVKTRDNAGNNASWTSIFVLKYDGTAPSNPTSCSEASSTANNTWQNSTSDPSFTWSGAGDGSGSGVSGYYYYWGTSESGTSTNYTASASYNPVAPGEGTFYLRVKTRDNASNNASWVTIFVFKYDATAPTVTSVSPSVGATNIAITTTITKTFDESMNQTSVNASFNVYQDGNGSAIAGTYSWSGNQCIFTPNSSLLPNTKYWSNVSTGAKDLAGNSLASANNTWFNTTAGVGVTVNSPNGGEVWKGGSTKWLNFTISGGSGPYTYWINYSTDGGSSWAAHNTSTVSSAGTYNWSLTAWNVSSTNCYVNITVNDSTSSGYDTNNNPFTIDSTAPTSSATTISPYWWNGAIDVPGQANDNNQLKNITLYYAYSSNNTTWPALNAYIIYQTSNISGTSWSISFSFLPPTGEGYYRFYTRAYDLAGNLEGLPGTNDTGAGYDTTSPSNPTSNTTNPQINVWTNDSTVYANWSGASDVLSGIAGYYYTWTTTSTYTPTTSDNYTTGSTNTSLPLSDNSSWYLHVRAKDNATNLASDAYHIGPIKIDTISPTNPTSCVESGGAANNTWQNSTSDPSFTWSGASDGFGSNVSGYYYYWGTSDLGTSTNYTTSASYNPFAPGEGTFYLRIKTRDNASNNASWVTIFVFKYDATAPTNPTACNETGGALNNTWQNSISDPSFNWSGAGDGSGSGVSGYYYYWGASDSGTSTNYTTTASYDPPAPGEGTFYLRVKTRDNASNNASWVTIFVFKYDATAPTVTSVSPAVSATNIAITTTITKTFNESMNRTSVEASFKIYRGGYATPLAGTYSWSGNECIFSPNSSLLPNTKYWCNVSTGAKDLAGNSLGAANNTWFTTTAGVGVTVNSPNGGEVWTGGAVHETNYTISGGTAPYTVKLYYSTTGPTGTMNFIAYDNRSAAGTFNYTWSVQVLNSTNCYMNVSVNDSTTSGYDLSNGAFEVDSTAPTVSSTDPANGITGVSVSTDVIVTFSEGMNTADTEAAFGLYKEGTATKVTGVFTWNPANDTLTFVPTANLDQGAKYYINITTGAKDDSSPCNALASAFSASFTTTAAGVSVTVNSPNGNEIWKGNTSYWINYTITGGTAPYTVKLYYSTTGSGGGWTFIAYHNRTATGTFNYTWLTPTVDSANCYVNISVNDSSASSYDLSNSAFIIDSTPPTTTYWIDGIQGDNGWYISNITINLSTPDAAYIVYRIDGGDWITYTAPFTVSADGSHTVQYKATDNAGNTAIASSTTFKIDQTPPTSYVLTLSTYQTASTSFTVQWTGSDPTSGSGVVVGYTIQVKDGAIGIWSDWKTNTLDTAATYIGTDEHTYYFRSIAKDQAGNVETDYNSTIGDTYTTIDTISPSTPSLISPANNSVLNTTNIAFSWYGAYDLNGISQYEIQIDNIIDFSSPEYSATPTSNSTSASLADGIYYWRVKAKDVAGNYGNWSAVWKFTVLTQNLPPEIISYVPTANPTINETSSITFSITATDPNNDSLTYQWYVNGVVAQSGTSNTFTFNSSYTSAGTYNITVTVSDGVLTDTRTWTLTIINVNRAPMIQSYTPALNSTINETESKIFSVVAYDPDGNNITYRWYLNSTLLAGETNDSYTFVSTYDSSGVYMMTVAVRDDGIPVLYTNLTWTLFVNNVNVLPIANFTYSPTAPTTADTIQFTDTSTDTDGTIVSRFWNFGDGNTSTEQNNQHKYSLSGTYTVKLTVTDNDSGNSTCTKEISVKGLTPNQQPVVTITYPSDSSVVWGVITITGTATDSDGTVQKVEVKIGDGSWQYATGTANWTYALDTALYAGANPTISARAYDSTDYSVVESVTVYVNIMPVASFMYYQGIEAIDGEYINVTLRVAGEKYKFVNLTVYENGEKVGFVSIERVPGKPEENTTSILIDSSKLYTILLEYTAEKKGDNPIKLTIEYKGISNTTHYVFQKNDTKELNLTYTIEEMLWATGFVKFDGSSSHDSDADGEIVNWTWNFGDGTVGYGNTSYHNYESGNYTVNLTVKDNAGALNTIPKSIRIVDITGYCAGMRGEYYGISQHCPAEMTIADGAGRIIGYNTTSGKFENEIPDATMILGGRNPGDFEIYIIPKNPGDFNPGDFTYSYKVTGTDSGIYELAIFNPGDFNPGDFNPGDFNPGDFNGTVHTVTVPTTTTTEDVIEVSADGSSLVIKSKEDKNYSMVIKKGEKEFTVSNVTITSGATHTYNVTDWAGLETSSNAVTLAVDINSDGISELTTNIGSGVSGQEIWVHKTIKIDGRAITLSYQGTYVIDIEPADQPGAVPEDKIGLGIFIKIISAGSISNLRITVVYSDFDIPRDTDESALKMYYWDESEGKWKICENTGVDIVNNIVWANVTHLTIFAPMAEKVKEAPQSLWLIYSGIGAVIAITAVSLAVVAKRKRKRVEPEE